MCGDTSVRDCWATVYVTVWLLVYECWAAVYVSVGLLVY